MGNRLKVAMLALALTVALAACGKPEAQVETARPVLVVHPSGGAQSAFSAYAGEIRAREESALSFRIGGSLVKRLVDAGDRVRRGQLLAELDAGDAADTPGSLSPVYGIGVGARYRSPVGPVNLDLAWGEETQEFRLHFSLGVSF